MNPTLRCKMSVTEVTRVINADGSTRQERVVLWAVTSSGSDENKSFAKWTPSAEFKISIDNPSAFGQLSQGHEYYVDFIPAPKATQ